MNDTITAGPEVRATMRRVSDGLERTDVSSDWPIDTTAETVAFMWAEGNYSCDCNRHLFFGRVVDPAFDEDIDCGETTYELVRLTFNGAVLVGAARSRSARS